MKPAHLRQLNRQPSLQIVALVVLMLGLSGCQTLGIGGEQAPPAEGTSVVAGGAVPSTASVDLTAQALSATPAPSPTPATPLPTPTVTSTPTVTPTPIPPGAAVRPAASALATKLSAFRTALAAKNVDRLSAAQLALLDEADQAEKAVQGDKSREANLVREAIEDIRGGAGGQTQLLDSAARELSQVGAGAGGTPTVAGGQTAKSVDALVTDLRSQLQGFQQARRERNSENLLKNQRDLIVTLNEVATATQGDDSPETKKLRDAAAGLRGALSGTGGQSASSEQLTNALAQMQAAIGSVAADGRPEDQASDLQSVAASLKRAGTSFRSALSGGNRTETARLQRELLDEVTKAEAALKNSPDASTADAQNLRAAAGALRDGAGGDTAKLDDGLNKLGAAGATSQQSGGTVDVKKTAESLQGKLASLQRAIQDGSTSDQLSLQRELYDEASKAEPALQGDTSKEADALRGAIGAIKSGVSGEPGKLDEADRQLRAATGKSAAPLSALTPTTPAADLSKVTSSLETRLTSLQNALERNDAEAAAEAEKALSEEANRAAASVQGQRSPQAEKLRAAITAAREAAGGDPTKLAAALELLRNAGQ